MPTYAKRRDKWVLAIGKLIRSRRVVLKMSAASAAKRASIAGSPVARSTWGLWESGKRGIEIGKLPQVAAALGFKDVRELIPSFTVSPVASNGKRKHG